MKPSAWGLRHVQACVGALGRLAREPLGSALTLVVIGIALALPAGLALGIENVRAATGDFSGAVQIAVYFKTGVPLPKAEQLARAAGERRELESVKLIPATQALEDFRRDSGFGAALGALEGNPLPHVLELVPRPDARNPAALEALRAWLAAWPEVDEVQLDAEWVQRFDALLATLRRGLGILAVLLGVGVAAVIGNAIRLEISGRRAEIEVIRFVGGSNAFVRRPFLYTGAWYGLLGALLAAGILALSLALLAAPVGRLAGLYGGHFALQGLALTDLAWLAGAGIGLGWLGAWVAAARALQALEPRP